jgi:hypothetical protein
MPSNRMKGANPSCRDVIDRSIATVIPFGNSYHWILAISIPVRRIIKNILPNTI